METYKDNHGILLPSTDILMSTPNLRKRYLDNICSNSTQFNTYAWNKNRLMKKYLSFRFVVAGQVTMKMLATYSNGQELSYRDVCKILQFPEGHDIDCWRGLRDFGLIEFSNKGKYGLQFYKITDRGKEVLSIAKANNVYHRVARWFKIDGADERAFAMIKADLQGEDASRDHEPETIIELLEALFNPKSEIHKIGSCYRWMNNVMNLLKDNDEFFALVDKPEILSWCEAHRSYYGMDVFLKKLTRIKNKNRSCRRLQLEVNKI